MDTASLSSESSERIDYLQYSGIFFWWKTGVAYGDSLHEFETAEACFCKAEEYVGPYSRAGSAYARVATLVPRCTHAIKNVGCTMTMVRWRRAQGVVRVRRPQGAAA